jgi:purine-binding chemotaxis protein CheW
MPETLETLEEIIELIDIEEISENTAIEKHLVFSISDRLYSFPSQLISEIVIFDAVYPLPLMPPYILGVINRYSIPYALFDIGLLLYPQQHQRSENTKHRQNKVLVLKDNIDRIAFLIDDVSDITDVPQSKIIDIERNAESNDFTETICASFNWNGNDVFVLDVHKILECVTGDNFHGGT